MRIVTIIGNRPQFVKAAAVSRRLREAHEELIVHTGQHYDDELSRIFFEELSVPAPDRELNIGGGTNTEQAARMLTALEPVLTETGPELVLVYGDTNSTLAGALAGAQARIPVGHVEAGMRSFDRSMPEELNRVLADHAADLLLCSTEVAVENLRREAVVGQVELVGVTDAVLDVAIQSLFRGQAPGFIDEMGAVVQPDNLAVELRTLPQGTHLDPGATAKCEHSRRGSEWQPCEVGVTKCDVAGVGGPELEPGRDAVNSRRVQLVDEAINVARHSRTSTPWRPAV